MSNNLTSFSQRHPQTNVKEQERVSSVAVGGGILAGLLLGHGMGRLLMYAAAGALIHRGMTGHCHLYEKLGIDTEHENKPSPQTPPPDAPVISL